MKVTIAILFLCTSSYIVYGQTETKEFKPSDYLDVKYKIDSLEAFLSNSRILLIKVYDTSSPPDFLLGPRIWLKQFKNDGTLLNDKFLGQAESEYGFYLPHPQPLDNFFMIVECSEYNGIIHLIRDDGKWVQIIGSYFAFNKERNEIVTKAAGDGEETISKMNLNTLKIETKGWANGGANEPWQGDYVYYYAKDDDWIK